MDSAVSKTCNVGDDVTYEEFKKVYESAWEDGCKGVTTFRASGKRFGILKAVETEEESEGQTESSGETSGEEAAQEVSACYIDPLTGQKECS